VERKKYAGFSEQTPWIFIPSNYKEINVEAEEQDPEGIFAYERVLGKQRLVVYHNLTEEEIPLPMPVEVSEGTLLLENYPQKYAGERVVSLRPYECFAVLYQ